MARYPKLGSDYIRQVEDMLRQAERGASVASLNKAILIGNLGKDPETRYTSAGGAVCNFSIATSERYTGSDGQQQEKTEWHKIVAFGKLAETSGKYLSKGKSVFVQGKIHTRAWEDAAGQKRYSTEIVAEMVQFLSPKENFGQGAEPDYA